MGIDTSTVISSSVIAINHHESVLGAGVEGAALRKVSIGANNADDRFGAGIVLGNGLTRGADICMLATALKLFQPYSHCTNRRERCIQ